MQESLPLLLNSLHSTRNYSTLAIEPRFRGLNIGLGFILVFPCYIRVTSHLRNHIVVQFLLKILIKSVTR